LNEHWYTVEFEITYSSFGTTNMFINIQRFDSRASAIVYLNTQNDKSQEELCAELSYEEFEVKKVGKCSAYKWTKNEVLVT